MSELAEYERRFRRAGLPLFIEDRSAREDVWTRAAPLLTVVFLFELLGAIDLDWSLLANLGAIAGGLAILVGAFGLLNRLRDRPFWSLPEESGRPSSQRSCSYPRCSRSCSAGSSPARWSRWAATRCCWRPASR